MSGLKEQALALAGRRGEQCSVAVVVARAVDDDTKVSAKELADALNDTMIPASGLSKALRGLGIDIGAGTIRRHRQGGCKC